MRRACGHDFPCNCIQPQRRDDDVDERQVQMITAAIERRLAAQRMPEVRAAANASADEVRDGIGWMLARLEDLEGAEHVIDFLDELRGGIEDETDR